MSFVLVCYLIFIVKQGLLNVDDENLSLIWIDFLKKYKG